jgi:phosphate transport system substrate-binding protein
MDKDADIVKTAILQSSNGALVQVVKGDADAIGFISFGYLNEGVKALSISGVAPTTMNVKSGAYPVVRPLLYVTKPEIDGAVKAFIDYCTGPEAQTIIAEEGISLLNSSELTKKR